MHQISLGESLIGVGISCVFYALALSTEFGQRWATAKTWTTVVVGTAIVLLWIGAYDWQMALYALAFFAVGGTPIVIRSLWIEYSQQEAIRRRQHED